MTELRMSQPATSYMQGRRFRRIEEQQDTQADAAEQQKQLNELELGLRKDKKLREEKTRKAEATAGNILSVLEAPPEALGTVWPQVYDSLDEQAKEKFPNGRWDPNVGRAVVQSSMGFMDRVKQIHTEEAAEAKTKAEEAKRTQKSQDDMAKLEREYELKAGLEKTKAAEKGKAAKAKGATTKIKNFEYLVQQQGMDPDAAAKRIFGSGVRVITNMIGGAVVIDEDSNKVIGEMDMSGSYTPTEEKSKKKEEKKNTTKSWLERKFGSR